MRIDLIIINKNNNNNNIIIIKSRGFATTLKYFKITTEFKIAAEDFIFAEKRGAEILWPFEQVCQCSILVTNLGTIHKGVLPNFFLLR